MARTLLFIIWSLLLIVPSVAQTSWPRYRGDNVNSGYSKSAAPLTTPKLKWEISGMHSQNAPIISNGMVFLRSIHNRMAAYNLQNGACVWDVPLLDDGLLSEPTVGEGKLVVGDWDGKVYALNIENGSIAWKFDTQMDQVTNSPIIDGGRVYFGAERDAYSKDGQGIIYALDIATGKLIWQFNDAINRICNSPLLTDNKLVFADDQYLYSLDKNTGQKLWKSERFSATGHHPHVPILVGNDIYLDYGNKSIAKVDLQTGRTKWISVVDHTIATCFASVAGKLYYGSSYELRALDIINYERLWKFEGNFSIEGSPLVTDKLVMFGSRNYFHALDNKTGKEIWRYETKGFIHEAAAIANGIIVVCDGHGNVYALE